MVRILKQCAFDENSLLLMNTKTIEEIEDFCKKNPHLLENTVYQRIDIENFAFKIGHKYLLLGIPEIIKRYREKKPEKRLRKFENIPARIPDNTLNNSDSELSPAIITDKVSSLIKKIRNYEKKFNLKLNVKETDIENILKTELGFKCSVVCPKCKKPFSCYNNSTEGGFWIISNLTTHVKLHLKKASEIQTVQSNHLHLVEILDRK